MVPLSSLSPFSGASIISKQLLLQPVPRPNHNRPITGQLCVWIWAALLNSGVCQYLYPALCLSFSFCHLLSFCFSLWLIKFFLPLQPTSFNMRPLAATKYQFKPPQQPSAFLQKKWALVHYYSCILFNISHWSKPSISSSDEGSCCVSKPTLHRHSLHKTFCQRER